MLSTPLTCCSIGVATDCSRACASAPTYVACNLISGGAIFGNWAIGRAAMDTAPTITVRIAMTMATMGRLMKNCDISFCSCLFRRAAQRLWVYAHTGNCLLVADDNHALAWFQSLADHHHR